jgi:NADH-quinone oxidoreductase subunit E
MTEGNGNAASVDLSLMEPVFEKYSGQPGALIPILQKAQDLYNFLPPEVLKLISDRLGIAMSKIYGVATFYAQFYLERRGKHVLKVCDGTACHVKGTPIVLTALEDQFGIQPGQTTADGNLTTEIVYCMGSCALAPVAVLDGKVIGRVRQETLVKAVKNHIGKG